MAATVRFDVSHDFPYLARSVWDRLTDWAGHGDWIPATRVELDTSGRSGADSLGTTFTAWTGFGKAAMPDRMVVRTLDWDDATSSGRCVVGKLGPVLVGEAGFTVNPTPTGCRVDWFEDVTIKRTPTFVGPLARPGSVRFFSASMRRLERVLANERD